MGRWSTPPDGKFGFSPCTRQILRIFMRTFYPFGNFYLVFCHFLSANVVEDVLANLRTCLEDESKVITFLSLWLSHPSFSLCRKKHQFFLPKRKADTVLLPMVVFQWWFKKKLTQGPEVRWWGVGRYQYQTITPPPSLWTLFSKVSFISWPSAKFLSCHIGGKWCLTTRS